MGAKCVEKHFTLDKNLPGPDHRASLEPEELRQMISAIRDVEKAMGDGIKRPVAAEEEVKKVARRSVVVAEDIPEGTVITGEMLALRRPGTGIEPGKLYSVIGKRTKRNMRPGELLDLSDVL